MQHHDQLLVTKLVPPPARAGRVARPALLQRLAEGTGGKLTLLSAPPGYGKSTLLAEFAARCPLPVAWVTLDGGESDPARFWSYAIAALQTVVPEVREQTPSLPGGRPEAPLEPAVAALINALARRSERVVLILDDYHLVDSEPVQRGMAFLIDNLPPQLHVIVAGRADPPLPLARWRAEGALIELRAAELRLTREEAGALLAAVLPGALTPEGVAALERRTEGWAAGLQLAALALRGKPDPEAFIGEFSGSHRAIVDYLIDEVVGGLDGADQAFLVETAVLDRLSGPLCDAVRGRPGSQTTLERLERTNLFLIPLDEERRWYRYHNLLSDVLRDRLRATRPDAEAALHGRAAAWFAANDYASEAIRHGLAAGDWPLVAGLVREIGPAMLTRGEFNTLLAWIERIPGEVLRASSSLCRIRAWALVFTGALAQSEAALIDAERTSDDLPPAERGEIAAVRACIARFRGNIGGALDYSYRALELIDERDALLRGVVLVNHAAGEATAGRFDDAYRVLDDADRLAGAAGEHLALISLSHRARLLMIQGRLRDAADCYQRALRVGIRGERPSFPATSYALIGMGLIWYQWNRLDEAVRALTDGITMGAGARVDLVILGYLTLARVKHAAGSRQQADELVREARAISERYGVPYVRGLVADFAAWLALADGDVDAAERWAAGLQAGNGETPTFQTENAQLVLARIAIARDRPAEALPILERLAQSARQTGRGEHLLEALVTESVARAAAGDRDRAQAAMRDALVLAEPQGYMHAFIDEGPAVAGLLACLRRDTTLPIQLAGYVDQLLAACSGSGPAPSALDTGAEPLTPRELEVLGRLAAGLSNREIADTLFVSVGTVKRHTNSIYGKLGVSNRGRAVAVARQLQLISL